jgi:rSAM/selenodomain-associated transferase 2
LISLIIPVRGEPPEAAERFAAVAPDFEMLVADGGSPPGTRAAFERIGARWLALEGKTRGSRLDAAARESRGGVLFFLHADSRPPGDARSAIETAVAGGEAAGAFRLAFEGSSPALRWIAAWANARSRWLGLPFGDQGIFCTRELYGRVGGFRDLPICDDLDFVRRLRRNAAIRILPQACTTSPRRYRGRALRQVLLNWKMMAGYSAGVSPETLDRWYRG